jgi:hypothetical protein
MEWSHTRGWTPHSHSFDAFVCLRSYLNCQLHCILKKTNTPHGVFCRKTYMQEMLAGQTTTKKTLEKTEKHVKHIERQTMMLIMKDIKVFFWYPFAIFRFKQQEVILFIIVPPLKLLSLWLGEKQNENVFY